MLDHSNQQTSSSVSIFSNLKDRNSTMPNPDHRRQRHPNVTRSPPHRKVPCDGKSNRSAYRHRRKLCRCKEYLQHIATSCPSPPTLKNLRPAPYQLIGSPCIQTTSKDQKLPPTRTGKHSPPQHQRPIFRLWKALLTLNPTGRETPLPTGLAPLFFRLLLVTALLRPASVP